MIPLVEKMPLSSVLRDFCRRFSNRRWPRRRWFRCSSPQLRLILDNRCGGASGTCKHKKHYVVLEPKQTWCREPQRRFWP